MDNNKIFTVKYQGKTDRAKLIKQLAPIYLNRTARFMRYAGQLTVKACHHVFLETEYWYNSPHDGRTDT